MNIVAPIEDASPGDMIQRLGTAATSYDIFRVLKHVAADYGYAYFMVMKLPDGPGPWKLEDLAVLTNWDPELLRAYDANGLAAQSPILESLKDSHTPVEWTLPYIKSKRNESDRDIAVQLFADFGHFAGIHLPTSDRFGKRGAIGFSGNRELLKKRDLGELSLICMHAYDKLCNIMESVEPKQLLLTPKEKDCLTWTASGKTSGETATILGISENTVNHYLTSAAGKLQTSNKAHTVAKAIRLGLLDD